ncbi:uncharacterized protein LOC126907849 isoform X2 [Daktulosphaira vitifoliae]|uniref:uncharacterized protein LOC126907849 isoform X2 n=1 Tax=Daktulosphaira vitifoliae TaxID=58002 RepID=UPI0021AAF981|nr:uncharacterized protein LOC126907849 isoform X2 [Daktulosphaira vitifoliae]
MMNKPNVVSNKNLSSKSNLNTLGNNFTCRSKSNLSNNSSTINLNPNITLERNGSMPNINLTGSRIRTDKTTNLHFAYDGYLCGLVAKYDAKKKMEKVLSNIKNQEKIFEEEMISIEKNLSTLNNEIENKHKLKSEKNTLNRDITVFKLLDNTRMFNSIDENIITLLYDAVHKIILKNFEKLENVDIGVVTILLDEILNPSILLDFNNKIEVRQHIKNLSIKIAKLTKELDQQKSIICELWL